MKQLNINGKSLLLVPVPEDVIKIAIIGGFVVDNWEDEEWIPFQNLPPGDWELIGKDPLNLSEEEAREIVEEVEIVEHGVPETWYVFYGYEHGAFRYATESLSSLLRANQMEKAIFLINKTK